MKKGCLLTLTVLVTLTVGNVWAGSQPTVTHSIAYCNKTIQFVKVENGIVFDVIVNVISAEGQLLQSLVIATAEVEKLFESDGRLVICYKYGGFSIAHFNGNGELVTERFSSRTVLRGLVWQDYIWTETYSIDSYIECFKLGEGPNSIFSQQLGRGYAVFGYIDYSSYTKTANGVIILTVTENEYGWRIKIIDATDPQNLRVQKDFDENPVRSYEQIYQDGSRVYILIGSASQWQIMEIKTSANLSAIIQLLLE